MSIRCPIIILLVAGMLASPAPAAKPADDSDLAAAEARIDQQIAEALAAADLAAREAGLAKVSAELGELVGSLTERPEASDAIILRRLRLELKLAETDGLLRASPYAMRLLYLQAGRGDRQALAQLTEGPVRRLEALAREIDSRLVVWQGDYRRMVTVVPELEDLRQTVAYKTAWVSLYRGLALEGDDARAAFARAAELAQPFAAGGAGSAVKNWSLLVAGIARRERGEYDRAVACLQPATDAQVDSVIRLEALYQLARSYIEQAAGLARTKGAAQADSAAQAFAAAKSAIEAFAKAAAEAPQGRDHAGDDLKLALLTHHLNQTMAETAGDEPTRRQHLQAAQDALGRFVLTRPLEDLPGEYLRIVAERYSAATNYDELNSVILLALAAPGEGEAKAADTTRVAELLEKILARSDELSTAVRPLAVWHLATIKAKGGDKLQAARLFVQLAKDSPDSSLARSAAVNAVICYNGLLAEAAGSDQPVDPQLREVFVAALELLLDRWGSQEAQAGWFFDLGWQYEKLAEGQPNQVAAQLLAKAEAAYQSMPPSCDLYMHARRRALDVRCRLLPAVPGAASQPSQDELMRDLLAYAADAHRMLATAAADKRDELRDWGAWAELAAAELLRGTSGGGAETVRLLRGMPHRWAGSPVLIQAGKLLAMELIGQGLPAQAVEAVDQLAGYDKQEAVELCRILVEHIRALVSADQQAGRDPGALRECYLVLSGYLYDHRERLDPRTASWARLAYAEALVQSSRAEEAVELLLVCQQEAEQAAAAERARIEAVLSGRLAAVQDARGDLGSLRPLAAQFLAELVRMDVKAEQSRGGWAVKRILTDLDGAVTAEQEQALLGQLADALSNGYREIAQVASRSIPARGDILELLARAYQDLGRFDQAAGLYKKLTEGLEGGPEAAAYWRAELGYCLCLLKARGDDATAMKSLAVRIAQLRQQDSAMGGLADRFAEIEAEVKASAGEDAATQPGG